MKKSGFLFTTILAVSLLAACGNSVTTTQQVTSSSLIEVKNPVEGAVEALKANFKASFAVKTSREYLNPWYSNNNFSKSLYLDQEYVSSVDDSYVLAKVAFGEMVDEGMKRENSSVEGAYEVESELVVEESLNHKNELIVNRVIDSSSTDYIHASETSLYNYFAHLDVDDFIVDEADATKYSYVGDFGAVVAKDFLGYFGKVSSAEFTLIDGKFTSFSFEYEKCQGRYVNTSIEGAYFEESLEVTGELSYSNLTLKSLTPVEGEKVEALETILAKYKNQNKFAVQPINPTNFDDGAAIQVVYDDGKVAVDFYNIFVDGALNSLSYLDSKLVLDEEKGKYYFNNVSMDENTEEFLWDTTENVVKAAGVTPREEAIYFEKDAFELDFQNIDTSLFTLRDGTTDTYDIAPAAAKYFGECIVPTAIDYAAASMFTGMYSMFNSTATKWSIRILDDERLYFECSSTLDLTGTSGTVDMGFILCEPGSADASIFYTEDLPSLE